MYYIHYVVSRKSDQPVDKVTFARDRLADAIERAKSIFKNTYISIPSQTRRPPVIGFIIFDTAEREVHRHYFEGGYGPATPGH